MISYEPFWNTLKAKGITQYELIHKHGFSNGTLNSLKHNKNLMLSTVYDICVLLDCDITDVVELIKE